MVLRFLLASTVPSMLGATVQTAISGGDFLDVFLRYGVVGVIAWLGLLFAYKQNQKTEARADRYEAKNSELEQYVRDKLLPSVIAATQTNAEVAQLMRDVLMRDRRPD